MFKKGQWYKTSDGFNVEFVRTIEEDGMYNVFRHTEDMGFIPYYTDINGITEYNEYIIIKGDRECLK